MQAQAHCPEPIHAATATLHPDSGQHKARHLIYQGATVLAILLFLFSFWSC
jgi:hypothetical protein